MNHGSVAAPMPSGLFWHIFKKDWRLLKLLAVANAVLQGSLAFVQFHSEPYPLGEGRGMLASVITLALIVTMCLLIVLLVQQEAMPGASQDWKVRPIKWYDLLIAKLLGVALLIHGPIAAAGLATGLAEGFPVGQVLRATALANLEIAMLFTLPVMAIGALTRSVGEALVGAVALFVSLLLVRLVIPALMLPFTHTYQFSGPADDTGLNWVWRFASHAALLAAAVAALLVQYWRRDTLRARAIFTGGLLLCVLLPLLPWRPAFAIQRWFARQPGAGNAISVAFDSQVQRVPADTKTGNQTRLTLPLRFTGVPVAALLRVDRCIVHLVGANNETIHRGACPLLVKPVIDIPTTVYKQHANQPISVELEFSLTLFSRRTLPSPLQALNGSGRLPEIGRCATRIDSAGAAVEVGCRQAGELPFCLSMTLELGRRNPEKLICEPNYEPAALRFDVEPLDHLHAKLPFRDPAGVALFPVDEAGWRTARIAVSVYEPQDHFSRYVVLAGVRLSDWETATSRP